MALNVWTQPSGYNFGSFNSETHISLSLPVENDAGVSYKIISGSLPTGLFLVGNKILGSGMNTSANNLYTFCVRASSSAGISDRTFTITIVDQFLPTFVTAEGALPVGTHKQYYVLDSSYVNYQLDALDLDSQGRTLTYFIASGDGSLPPGLTLSSSGLISGYIEPLPSITEASGNGNYDQGPYDNIAYDFGLVSSNGFDDYQYDNVFFDYNVPTTHVQTLSINYQFKVTLTDGVNVTQGVFRIFVTGTDQFSADSTSLNGLADEFTADSTFIREPVWAIGASNATGIQKLGAFKSNNYLTIPIALYDNSNVIFRLEVTNQEVYANTVQASRIDNLIGSSSLTVTNLSATPVRGQYFSLEYYLDLNGTGTVYQISSVTDLGNGIHRLDIIPNLTVTVPNGTPFYIGSLSKLPPGTEFNANTGDVYGTVPYQPAITKTYEFTLTATRINDKINSISSSRTFSIDIIGNITNVITWVSPNNLGTIDANYVCTLNVSATSSVPGAIVVYEFTPQNANEQLPPGLTLSPDGELIGIVNQFYDAGSGTLGLITLDGGTTTFDQSTTTFNRVYTFTITATDQYGYNNVQKQFTVTVTSPNTVTYSNIVTTPFLKSTQRAIWKNFITSSDIFTPSSIYRYNDLNFGLQQHLTMLIYAGIETNSAETYVSMMGLNHKRKRFLFSDVKTAIAIDPETGDNVYEVVYIQMLDPMEPNGKHLPLEIKTASVEPITITADDHFYPTSIDSTITVDSQGYEVSNPNIDTYFPNSITNWRSRIQNWSNNGTGVLSERDYLPLWMRSIPAGQKQQINYTLAVPLCFCKPGTSAGILNNILNSGFDFKTLDYTVDRYVITPVTSYGTAKYYIFKNDRITI